MIGNKYEDSLLLLYSFICLLLAFKYILIKLQIAPLTQFPTINSISIFVNNSNSTLVFFIAACQANLGAERVITGSNS